MKNPTPERQIVLVKHDSGKAAEQTTRLLLEISGTVHIARVRQEQREQHGATRSEQSARPPKMKRARMPMADGFLPRGMAADDRNRKIHLRQPLTFFRDDHAKKFLREQPGT